MLKEDQVAELLARCEAIAGIRLNQVRGNLTKAESRSAAIWELIVFEEASRIGKVEYEPSEGASPDILLTLETGEKLWIEVAYLYPRFWKQERSSNAVSRWLLDEAKKRGLSQFKVSCSFDGDRTNPAGPIRNLPHLHERKKFILGADVRGFFKRIEDNPELPHCVMHSEYSVKFQYSPNKSGPYITSGGGLVQEVPKTIKEHAVYRIIKQKSRQHDVTGKRLVCIGSDQSPVLSSMSGLGNPGVRDAVYSALKEATSLSGVLVIKIEDKYQPLGGFSKGAKGDIYLNPWAKVPLSESGANELTRFNFNRWKYFFSLKKYEHGDTSGFERVSGSLSVKLGGNKVEIEVPSNLLIDSLAGKTNILESYSLKEDDPVYKYLDRGWVITGCKLKGGDIEKGISSIVVLELAPPPEKVFWPQEEGT